MGEALLAFTAFYLVIIGATLIVGFLKTRPKKKLVKIGKHAVSDGYDITCLDINEGLREAAKSLKKQKSEKKITRVKLWHHEEKIRVTMGIAIFELLMTGYFDDDDDNDAIGQRYRNMALKYYLQEPIDFDTEFAILAVIEE